MPIRLLRAALLPLTELSVLLPILMFWALISFGVWRLPLGVKRRRRKDFTVITCGRWQAGL